MAETREKVEPEPGKEPYSTPQLVRHGTVEELTQGAIPAAVGDSASAIP